MSEVSAVQVFDEELVETCRQLRDTRDSIASMKTQEDQLRKKIFEALGDNDAGVDAETGDIVVSKKISHRRNVNRAKLEAMFPDIFDQVVSESEVVSLDIPRDRAR